MNVPLGLKVCITWFIWSSLNCMLQDDPLPTYAGPACSLDCLAPSEHAARKISNSLCLGLVQSVVKQL